MMTLRERLEWAMTLRGVNAATVAREARVSDAAISQILSGKTKELKLAHCFRIAKFLDVEPQWLGMGLGPRTPEEKVLDAMSTELSRESQEHMRLYVQSTPDKRHAATTLLRPAEQPTKRGKRS